MPNRLLLLLATLIAVQALAEAPAAANYPLLQYRPALADYVPYRETGLNDWRAVNDAVERLGGHIGHARMPAGVHHHGHGGRDASDRPPVGRQPGQRP